MAIAFGCTPKQSVQNRLNNVFSTNWKQTLEWFTCGETVKQSDPKKQQSIVENQRSQNVVQLLYN